jgi:hypothetical protein
LLGCTNIKGKSFQIYSQARRQRVAGLRSAECSLDPMKDIFVS